MKSLLKFCFICLLAFFTSNTVQAQCSINMNVQKVSETSTSVTYYVGATTTGTMGRILVNGISTCQNTNSCGGYKTISKSCAPKTYNFKCSVKGNGCFHADGCIVVIGPLSGC